MLDHYLSPALARNKTASPVSSDMGELMHNKIWRAILERKLKPGTKLPEDELGRSFSVSRTIVRKVLIVLEQDGVVSLPAGRGAFIASPTKAETHEIFEILQMTSCHLIRQLASRRQFPAAHAKLLSVHLDAQRKLSAEETDAHSRLALEFFILLAHLHGNCALAAIHEKAIARVTLSLMLYQKAAPSCMSHDHIRSISDLIVAGQAEKAVSAMTALLQDIESKLLFTDAEEKIDLAAILSLEYPEESVSSRKKSKHTRWAGAGSVKMPA